MMHHGLKLPAGFPTDLAARAYRVGRMSWPAWTQEDAIVAVEAFRSMLIAVTDGELGVRTSSGTQTHYTTAHGDFVYSFGSIEREEEQSWEDFVAASCDEVSKLLREFRPKHRIVEPCTLGFMLIWQSNEEPKA